MGACGLRDLTRPLLDHRYKFCVLVQWLCIQHRDHFHQWTVHVPGIVDAAEAMIFLTQGSQGEQSYTELFNLRNLRLSQSPCVTPFFLSTTVFFFSFSLCNSPLSVYSVFPFFLYLFPYTIAFAF